jgi:predicted methyltransferase
VTNDLKNWLEKDGENFLKAIGLKKGQVVLDFGCGEGHYSIPAAKVVGEKGRSIVYDELHRVLRAKGTLSLYPKHHKNDLPLMELARMKLEEIIREVEEAGFSLQNRLIKGLIHDDYFNEGCILHFRKD